MALKETCDRAVCSSLFVVATLVAFCAFSRQPVNPCCSRLSGVERWCAIASLWSVDDGGTQALMNTFYTTLNTNTIIKAEALRQAQIALITQDFSAIGGKRGLQLIAPGGLPASVTTNLNHLGFRDRETQPTRTELSLGTSPMLEPRKPPPLYRGASHGRPDPIEWTGIVSLCKRVAPTRVPLVFLSVV
ncbi:CHAT domain-containing protein [Coleofasciculus chthonoplastes]|uniref:CHAT domain-containing protein n=1 Tax=Coleofasciculus chthonoplastes TaxID=64178 RepID=UPI0032F1B14A